MRLKYIDNIKGFAIILVVLAHVIQFLTHPSTFEQNPVTNLINSYHMSLFVFVSGYTFGMNGGGIKLIRRMRQLLLPFVIWGIIYSLYQGHRFSLFVESFLYPNYTLWFLWVLFFVALMGNFTIRLNHSTFSRINFKSPLLMWTFMVLCILIVVRHFTTLFGIPFILWLYPHFMMGVFAEKGFKRIKDSKTHILFIAAFSLCLYAILCYNFPWQREGYTINVFFERHIDAVLDELIKFVKAECGISFTFVIFFLLDKAKIHLPTETLGRISLGIYALQFPIIWIVQKYIDSETYSLSNALLLTAVILIICSILTSLFDKIPIMKTLLLGKSSSSSINSLIHGRKQ